MGKSRLLLIALALGLAYGIYSLYYWGGAVSASSESSAEAAGAAIATVLVMPHLVCTLIAVIFNALGFFLSKPAFALVAGILYAVAMVLFPTYFFFVIVQMILCFVAYALMKKAQKEQAAS